jgi:hypothetical protein
MLLTLLCLPHAYLRGSALQCILVLGTIQEGQSLDLT